MSDRWLTFIPAIITAAVGVAGLLGLAKYLIEPWYNARMLRGKYAIALWIACADLKARLEAIRERVTAGDPLTLDRLKKIPNKDSMGKDGVQADWFTKDGYYTTSTAYKIAAVSAWLSIFRRVLFFLPYAASPRFLATFSTCADRVIASFSADTCLWYDYLTAVGDGLVVRPATDPASSALPPLSFVEFCERYTTDTRFRLFYEQVHMYIWLIADRQKPYLDSVDNVVEALDDLRSLLTHGRLLRRDFDVTRRDVNPREMTRRVA